MQKMNNKFKVCAPHTVIYCADSDGRHRRGNFVHLIMEMSKLPFRCFWLTS